MSIYTPKVCDWLIENFFFYFLKVDYISLFPLLFLHSFSTLFGCLSFFFQYKSQFLLSCRDMRI
uniref:Uncharacterized protein n=1 Tax=Physcomitrium patens TaxID=3218 RepID=A0A2K1JDE4_PHYPA|nr:hypothetical protein PHYPA_019821 [Physcomitrium patens]